MRAVLDEVAEDVVFDPGGGRDRVLYGREQVSAYLDRLEERGVRLRPRSFSFDALGDQVVVSGGLRTTGPRGLVDRQVAWLYGVRAGRVASVESFGSRAEALRAARERVAAAA